MSAHHWIKNARRAIAHWFYEPFATTAWQPTPPLALPEPTQKAQTTGEIQLPDILAGIAGGKQWNGAPGTWAQVYAGTPPHRRRETGKIGPHTGAHTPIPPTPQDTDGIQQLPQDNREWSDVATAKKLPMQQALDALAERKNDVPALPIRHLDPTGDLLATMRPPSRHDLPKTSYADLPTVPSYDARVREALARVNPDRLS